MLNGERLSGTKEEVTEGLGYVGGEIGCLCIKTHNTGLPPLLLLQLHFTVASALLFTVAPFLVKPRGRDSETEVTYLSAQPIS